MSVAVITDSAAAMPSEVAQDAGIAVMPMWVTVGGETLRDTELPLPDLLRRYDEGLSTSGPSPGDFDQAIRANLDPDGALLVTVAARMSGSHQAALLAAAPFGDRVRVLDSRTAAGSQALVALAAARRARGGGSLDEVAAAAGRVAGRVRLVASLGGLDWLVRSGHVPEVVAWAGRSLGIRPVVEFRGGRVRPLRPARTERGATERILAEWRRGRPTSPVLRIAAMHGVDQGPARRLLEAVRAELEPAEGFIGGFTAVMVAHTGPDLFGLAWWWEDGPG